MTVIDEERKNGLAIVSKVNYCQTKNSQSLQ
jgi:hypothetical protein